MPNSFVSFLKSFGAGVKKVVDTAMSIEQKAAPFLAVAVPTLAPEIDIANRVVTMIKTAEGTYTAVGQQANGPAKLQAVVGAISTDFDAWINLQLPGGATLQDAENYAASKSDFVNSVVKALNSFSATQQVGTVVSTGEALIAASAAKAAAVVPAKV
jgi:hypothetical protein